ncbi:MAG: Na+/H+ antiporter NhaC [Luminiphilus sp.]|jgi:Na+:H+ antiporter, NhaC family|nr:Na+/H+ antiporter NhaC [Luminiphilus sp.]
MLLSLLPIVLLVGLLFTSVALFGSDASYGPNQVALMIAAAATMLVGWRRGLSWQAIQDGMVGAITVSIMPMMILLSVGALIGSWIISGTVPGMIYYGVQLLDPSVFYAASAVICALASLSLGSSWTVAGTLGIGLMGIANTYSLSPAVTAGAVISGAYFGDKLSPLSDTTNLAAAAVGVDLFEHIKNMLWTTLPAFATALLVFALMGSEGATTPENITVIRTALASQFTISPWVLSPLALMLGLIYWRVPAYPAILICTLSGTLYAALCQPEVVRALALEAHPDSPAPLLQGLWMALFSGYQSPEGMGELGKLLDKGGLASMLNTIFLILTAMTFGGMLDSTGILRQILDQVLRGVKRTGDLILATVSGGIITNVLAADQFLAITLPGRLFTPAYDDRGLSRLSLSRTLEDSATLTSVLVPWNTCGAFMAATLGVATFDYAPYALFNLICPVLAVIFGYLMIAQPSAVAADS